MRVDLAVHWDLLTAMTAADVRVVIEDAIRKTGAHPEVVRTTGVSSGPRTSRRWCGSSGWSTSGFGPIIPSPTGGWSGFTAREALGTEDLANLSKARVIIGRWVQHYNHRRLHAALQYLPPAEYYAGNPAVRMAERREKLEGARQHRVAINRKRMEQAA